MSEDGYERVGNEVGTPPAVAVASSSWLNLWTAAGGIAGAVAFVYVLGSAVEALRLHHAGLPVEQAIAVVPRATLVAAAVDALLLPVSAAVAVALGMYLVIRARRGSEVSARRLMKSRRKRLRSQIMVVCRRESDRP